MSGPRQPSGRYAANDGSEPILLKNSKNPQAHFSARIRYIGKVGPVRTERAVRAAYVAKALTWPTTSPKFPTGTPWRSFSPFLEKTEFFNTISPKYRMLRDEQMAAMPSS